MAEILSAYVIVDSVPEGYRWATEKETETWWWDSNIWKMVQVLVGHSDQGDPMTDFAIRE